MGRTNYEPAGVYDEATGCWVEVYEDGGRYEDCEDGSGSWFDPNTGLTETWSPSIYDEETGCTTQIFNGNTDTWCDDGTSYWEDENGGMNISAYDETTGCFTETFADGSSSVYCEDGFSSWTDPEGNTETWSALK